MKKTTLIGAAVGLALSVSQAFAGKLDYPAYIGAGGSYANWDSGLSTSGDLDEDDWGWKLFGGYRFHENFAVEAFYADFGEIDLDLAAGDTVEGMVALVPIDFNIDAQSFGASAILLLPVSDEVDFFGKLGIHSWDVDANLSGGGITVDADDNGTDAFFGVGASFAPTENVSLRLEYEAYLFDGSNDLGLTTLGLELHF